MHKKDLYYVNRIYELIVFNNHTDIGTVASELGITKLAVRRYIGIMGGKAETEVKAKLIPIRRGNPK